MRARGWCFTLNNYTDADVRRLLELDSVYIVFGREVAPTTGTPHLQGYVYFANPVGLAVARGRVSDRAHLVAANGTAASNRVYCIKDGDFEERGQLPQQGRRSDISAVRELVDEGKNMRDICRVASSYQAIRCGEALLRYRPFRARQPVVVSWYWGATGTGKTHRAFSEAGSDDTWVCSDSLRWFDGYDGQANVIFDDIRGDSVGFGFFLRLLDRYPLRVPVKGGFVEWVPVKIWITCPHHPRDCGNFWPREDMAQLLRRLSVVRRFQRVFVPDDIPAFVEDDDLAGYIE